MDFFVLTTDSSSPPGGLLKSVVKTKRSMEQNRQRAYVIFESAGADMAESSGLDRGLNRLATMGVAGP